MSSNLSLEDLFRQIRDICASEYKRGEEDTIARIMKAAVPHADGAKPEEEPRRIAANVVRSPTRREARAAKMVPRGLPDRFVKKVMAKVPGGISPSSIQDHAETPMEKRIAYATIRVSKARSREG